AREEPIEGVNSAMLLHKMELQNKRLIEKNALVAELSKLPLDVLMTMGAGDIDTLIEPIKTMITLKK
ncbi:MAG: hypothetical protein RIQ78_952, partial [Bacteroidota bacterium]